MKKIPTIFKRNPENRKEILPEKNPVCDWVFAGEGVATRKYDGTCCLIKEGKLYKRREIKIGDNIPIGFEIADTDNITQKIVGWMPVDIKNAEDKWHIEAFRNYMTDGTYELLGPKIQGNHEEINQHFMTRHSDAYVFENVPLTYEGLREWLKSRNIEGIVFHNPDGRMAKIKKRDYGLSRNDE